MHSAFFWIQYIVVLTNGNDNGNGKGTPKSHLTMEMQSIPKFQNSKFECFSSKMVKHFAGFFILFIRHSKFDVHRHFEMQSIFLIENVSMVQCANKYKIKCSIFICSVASVCRLCHIKLCQMRNSHRIWIHHNNFVDFALLNVSF